MKYTILSLLYYILNSARRTFHQIKYLKFRNKYGIHPSFVFNGIDIDFYGDGKIQIGENSYIGNRSAISSVKNHSVVIGSNCAISHNVRIYTSNRNPDDIITEKKTISHITGNVEIGDNCWIGANVLIIQGIKIGNNTVIGANSVVTKSFPSNLVIAGCPARIIKSKKSSQVEHSKQNS